MPPVQHEPDPQPNRQPRAQTEFVDFDRWLARLREVERLYLLGLQRYGERRSASSCDSLSRDEVLSLLDQWEAELARLYPEWADRQLRTPVDEVLQ